MFKLLPMYIISQAIFTMNGLNFFFRFLLKYFIMYLGTDTLIIKFYGAQQVFFSEKKNNI